MSIVRKIIGFFLQAISVAAAIYSAAMVIAAFTTMATAMIVFFGGGVFVRRREKARQGNDSPAPDLSSPRHSWARGNP